MLEYNNYRAPLGPILAPVPKCLDLREVACLSVAFLAARDQHPHRRRTPNLVG